MLRKGAIFAAVVSVAACASFGATSSPPSVDAGVDAAPQEAAPPPPPPGTTNSACAELLETYADCHDYEKGQILNATENVSVEGPGRDSEKALVAHVVDDDDHQALERVAIACTAKKVAWSFDVYVEPSIIENTELTTLLVQRGVSGIQVVREKDSIEVIDWETRNTNGNDHVTAAKFLVPESTKEWVRIQIAVDYTTKTVSASLTRQNGSKVVAPDAPVRPSGLEDGCELAVGLHWRNVNGEVTVRTDNVAWRVQ